MNYLLAIFTQILLAALFVKQIRIWKMRVLLSPAFYFSIIWSMGVIGCLVLYPLGLMNSSYPQYINELNIFLAFTSICFIFFTAKGRNKIVEEPIQVDISLWKVYRILSVIFVSAAIYDFYTLGGNLNMGYAREHVHEIIEAKSTIVNYISKLGAPLSIYAGYKVIFLFTNKKERNALRLFFLLLPLFGNLIFSVNVGGRVDFMYSYISYLVGFGLGLSLNQMFGKYKKEIYIVFLMSILVLLFVSSVSRQRRFYNHSVSTDEIELALKEKSIILGYLYAPIQYVISTFDAYQLRRIDAVDEDELGWGIYTFNGFINWTLPFSSQFGMGDFSIAKELDVYYNAQETYDYERELFYNTHSCYLTMVKDFGYWGTFLCIFFLTWIAHTCFVRIQRKKHIRYAMSFFFFFLFWNYWCKSNFYGTLSSTVLVPLYGFLLVDISNFLAKKR